VLKTFGDAEGRNPQVYSDRSRMDDSTTALQQGAFIVPLFHMFEHYASTQQAKQDSMWQISPLVADKPPGKLTSPQVS